MSSHLCGKVYFSIFCDFLSSFFAAAAFIARALGVELPLCWALQPPRRVLPSSPSRRGRRVALLRLTAGGKRRHCPLPLKSFKCLKNNINPPGVANLDQVSPRLAQVATGIIYRKVNRVSKTSDTMKKVVD